MEEIEHALQSRQRAVNIGHDKVFHTQKNTDVAPF